MMNFKILSHRASVMLLTLMFMTSLSVVAATYLFSVYNSTRMAGGDVDTKRAFYLAEAGVEKATWYLLHTAPDGSKDGSWRTASLIESLNNGTYTLTVTSSGTTITVKSVGTYNNVTRTVQKQISLTFPGAGKAQVQLQFGSISGGTTPDSSGNGYAGTLVGNPSQVSGRTGGAMQFSPGNYVSLGNILQASYNNISLSAWVKRSGNGTTETLIARGNRANADGIGLMLISGVASFGHADSYVASDVASIADNTWHLVTGVMEKNGSNFDYKVYVDGKLAGYSPGSSTGLTSTSNGWAVGAAYDGSNPLTGSEGDVRIFTRALSAAEVKDIYEQGLGNVGWWKLDDGSGTFALDSSIYGNNGTTQNNPTWTNGQINGAVNFNGSTQYINAGNGSSLDLTTAATLSAWIYYAGPGLNNSFIVIKQAPTGQSNAFYGLLIFPDGNLRFSINTVNSAWTDYVANVIVPQNQWTHIAGTYTSGSLNIYVNGVLVKTYVTPTGNLRTTSGPLLIGREDAWYNESFKGAIDDVRIYNTALTASEVTRMYQEGIPSGIKGWWKFDESSTTNGSAGALDSSGNAYTGTWNGPPSPVSGQVGPKALSFDSSKNVRTSLVNVGYSAGTVSWWMNPSKAYNATGNQGVWSQYGGSDDGLTCQAWSDGKWYCGWNHSADRRVSCSMTAQNYVQNQWNHYALTWTASGSGLYQNGSLICSNNSAPVVANLNQNFYIGTHGTATSEYFSGLIDDVRVYNRALPTAELKSLYDAPALVGWWKFDEGSGTVAADSSGAGNLGTLTSTTWASGHVGAHALTFNGTNSNVNVPSFSTSGNTQTAAFWLKVDPNWYNITQWLYVLTIGSNQEFNIQLNPSAEYSGPCPGTKTLCPGLYTSPAASQGYVSTSINVADGQWHHIAAVNTASTGSIYIDGVLASSSSLVFNSASNLNIGSYKNSGAYFPGLIDDVRIFSRALSADEVYRVYQEGATLSGGAPTGATFVNNSWTLTTSGSALDSDSALVAWWKFDESSTTNGAAGAVDSSGHNHAGTWQGPPTAVAGKVGSYALQFTGSQYVSISPPVKTYNQDSIFTFSAWFNTNNAYTGQAVVSVGDKGSTNTFMSMIYIYSGMAYFGAAQENVDWRWVTTPIVSAQWYHVAGVYNNRTMKIYLNGSLKTTGTFDLNTTPSSSVATTIGMQNGGSGNYFNGIIDDVRIYSRELSADEVLQLYNQ